MKKVLFSILFLYLGLTVVAQVQPPAGFGNNIILWLSPDSLVYRTSSNLATVGDRVTEWHDISGGGYVFTNTGGAVRPNLVNYQGRNMLNFVNGDFLENLGIAAAINGLSEFSIYVVIKSDDVNTDQGFLDSENPDGADDILCMRYDASGANTGRTNLIKCGMQGNTPNNQIESQSNTQINRLQCLALTWRQGEPINLYIDGTLNESSNNNLNSAMSGIQKILLGRGPKDTGGSSGWDGKIGTVIFYNTKMSPDTVALITGDLRAINSVQSGNWDDPNTWDCNCNPPASSFVKINNNHTVTLTQNETVTNVIIAPNGTVDLSVNNYRLSVRKDFTNHGNLVARQGRVRFNGTTGEQLINGSAATGFHNLVINNVNGVRVTNGSSTIQGTLNIQNGCFETGNRVTLLSNATRTARIAEITSGACIIGDITMQRYIDAGATDWRFITSPVSGATLAELNDDFVTSGFPGSDFPLWPTAANPWPSIYYYDETQAGVQDNGFNPATNISNPIGVGEGLWVYCGDTIIGTQPFTIDITGPPNVGDISLPMTYTNSGFPSDDGWNMVGNPYPSTLDWDDANITKTNINNAIYIWNPDLQQFGSYVGGIGTNGASNNIASSQAFWVQANSSGASITVREASKTGVDGAFLKPTVVQPFRIKAQNNYGTDEIVIHFDNNATNGFDPLFDAEKMTSVNTSLPRLSSITGLTEFSINQLPTQEISIPIKLTTDLTGLHQISVENIEALGNVACLRLEDLITGTTYDLNAVQTFTAYINDTTTIARYLLHIGAQTDITTSDISCFGKDDGKIVFSKTTNNPFNITWKDANQMILGSSTGVLSDTLIGLTKGTYTIESTDIVCGNKIDIIEISEPASIVAQFNLNADTLFIGEVFTPINQTVGAIDYQWNFGDGNTSNLVNPSHSFTNEGNYLIELQANQNSTCFDTYSRLIIVTGEKEELAFDELKTWLTGDELNVSLNMERYKEITLRNALGQLIYSNSVNSNVFSIDLSDFSAGIYIVSLSDINNASKSIKIAYSK